MVPISGARARALSVVAGCALLVAATVGARASVLPSSFVFTIEQVGPNVVVTGSGDINLSGMSIDCTACSPSNFMWPSYPGIVTGQAGGLADEYAFSTPPTGPSNFGTGGPANPTTASGDIVGANYIPGGLIVPAGYTSYTPLSDSATYDNTTLALLGLVPGTYTWTWQYAAGGATAGSFTIDVIATPLPAALPLFAAALGGLGLLGWLRKRNAAAVAI